ncbi:helix-turn-helix domain-containing protein [Paenibacillus tyrfis]|uniref:helix-turn-helix domain-containing protein n=1 Tax=Paenibacillus tyrfis TaxID=1501230 RepID=UPI000B58C965|nr:helix-turn-helix transcriptional regulator [Paenibacillus tyrfis]
MSIGEAIGTYRSEDKITQRELANKLNMDRSLISKIETGERSWPEAYDAKLASLDWKLALKLADERTGGFISNILDDVPNLDLHPAALKDVLLKDLDDLEHALEGLVLAKHIDPVKRRESAERVWQEIRDVMEKAAVLQGVLEEEFGLDRRRLAKKHEMEVKRGER